MYVVVMGQLGRGDSCEEQCRSPGRRVSSRRGCWYRILCSLAHRSMIDKLISESDWDFVVLRRYWLEGEEENIPSFEGVW